MKDQPPTTAIDGSVITVRFRVHIIALKCVNQYIYLSLFCLVSYLKTQPIFKSSCDARCAALFEVTWNSVVVQVTRT